MVPTSIAGRGVGGRRGRILRGLGVAVGTATESRAAPGRELVEAG